MTNYAAQLGLLALSPPAVCPHCKRIGVHHVVHETDDTWLERDPGGSEEFAGKFRIVRCSNCTRHSFLQSTAALVELEEHLASGIPWDPNDLWHHEVFPPLPARTLAPSWLVNDTTLDEALRRLLKEAYRAADAGIFSLAVVGLRAALEQFVRLSDQDPDATQGGLAACIRALMADHKINAAECRTLMAVKDGGDAAIHRNFQPSGTMFETLASPLLELLRPNTGHAKVAAIAHQIPPRPSKPKKPRGPQQR